MPHNVISSISCQAFISCNYRILFQTHSVVEYVTCTVFRAKAAEEHSLPTVNIKLEQKICVNPKPKKKSRLYCKPINCKCVNARNRYKSAGMFCRVISEILTIISKEINFRRSNACRIAHAHQAVSFKKYTSTAIEKCSLMGETIFLMLLSLFKKMPECTTASLAFLTYPSFINLFTQTTRLS